MTADTIRCYVRTNLFTDDELQLDEASYSNTVSQTYLSSSSLTAAWGVYTTVSVAPTTDTSSDVNQGGYDFVSSRTTPTDASPPPQQRCSRLLLQHPEGGEPQAMVLRLLLPVVGDPPQHAPDPNVKALTAALSKGVRNGHSLEPASAPELPR